jgi:hypothetical protein
MTDYDPTTATPSPTVQAEYRRTLAELRRRVEESGTSELLPALTDNLTFEGLFDILREIDVTPGDFFEKLYSRPLKRPKSALKGRATC